jgi:hypothetical protein
MSLELEKIKQIASYLAEKMDNLYFTKFLKLLYYLDFISILERGTAVTNDTYFHLPYGPVPAVIKEQLALLRSNNKKEEESISSDATYTDSRISIFEDVLNLKHLGDGFVLKNKKPADISYLSEYEKGLLDNIIDEFKDKTTKEIVDKTHTEVPYIQTPADNVIAYKLAFYLDRDKILPKRSYAFNPEISQSEFFGN